MKFIPVLLASCFTFCCSIKSDVETNANSQSKSLPYRDIILRDFNSFDANHLYKYDSCSFVKYISNYFNLNKALAPRLLGDWRVYSETCPYNYFNFAILHNQENDSLLYYGLSDLYVMRQSETIQREKLIRFENGALNRIVNKLLIPSNLSRDEKWEKLRDIIGNLYFENFGDFTGVKKPFFTNSLTLYQLNRRYNNNSNKEIFQSEFSGVSDSELIILENPLYGTLIFKFNFSDNNILIKEFMIISKDRKSRKRLDSYPSDIEDCLKIH